MHTGTDAKLWDKTREILRDRLAADIYDLWIAPLNGAVVAGGRMEIQGPDRFFCSWIKENYLALICRSAAEAGGREVSVSVSAAPAVSQLPVVVSQTRLPEMPETQQRLRALHPRFTFDEFMVGESNALAYSACRAMAAGDESLGSCLFIHSGSGLGKTHLTQAVARQVFTFAPAVRLHYLSAQQFSAEMVQGIKSNTMDSFKGKYLGGCDLLLLEDIHTLNGKNKTQEELNEVLDTLIKAGKRVILTAPLPPGEIKGIDSSICSRISGGLRAAITPPDLETRKQILVRKALAVGLELSPSQVEILAGRITGDVRRLESAIIGLKAKSSLLGQQPDREMLVDIIQSVTGARLDQKITSAKIRDVVCQQFKLSAESLTSRARKQQIAFPRHLAMYICRLLTSETLDAIGRTFNRDHSTVLHASRVIMERLTRDASVRGQVDLLTARIKAESDE